jgi:hypothetical protein
MQVYKRTLFSMIRGIIVAPFSGLLVFIIAQLIFPSLLPLCAIIGVLVAALIVYIAVFSENIYFELEDDGTFRYYKKGVLQTTYELARYRIGYHRKTEWGLLGNNDIRLKFLDDAGEETEIDAGPLGTTQFDDMFASMEKYAIKDIETLSAGKNYAEKLSVKHKILRIK